MSYKNFIKNNNLILAPMAGVSDSAFRVICQQNGALLTYSEMVSAKALSFNDKKTLSIMSIDKQERSTVIQMFGNDKHIMANGAQIISEHPCVAIDINMGCPAPKIVNNGDGCALMGDIKKASEIISAVKANSKLPVTVKFRKGLKKDSINGIEFAKMAEDSGADAIAIHGRTRCEYYSGQADIPFIASVKNSVTIPVIANGDIFDHICAKKMFDDTGCDAIMIGRGAMGNPFIFSQIAYYLEKGITPPPISFEQKLKTLEEHITLMVKNKGENLAMLESRKHVPWYFKGMPHSGVIKSAGNSLSTLPDFYSLLERAREIYS